MPSGYSKLKLIQQRLSRYFPRSDVLTVKHKANFFSYENKTMYEITEFTRSIKYGGGSVMFLHFTKTRPE